jgi:tRNA 2-thiocytidine biosynthesis protein TtcA
LSHHLPIVDSRCAAVPFLPESAEASVASAPLRTTELGAFRYKSKLEMRIVRKLGRAVAEWGMIGAGDRVMVCVSGGKDSYALLDLLLLLRRTLPVHFDVFAVNLDQGWPGYDTARIEAHLRTRDVEYYMANAAIAPIVEAKLAPDATPCSLCSRLRRGVIYNAAVEHRATRVALGHHLDDAVETLLLNLFFSGQLKAMPPKLLSDDGRNVVIRPLIYVEERDLIEFAAAQRYPTVRCSCPTCGLPDSKRQVVKRMLAALEAENPGLKTQMLAALRNVKPAHLLDRALLQAMGLDGIARASEDHPGSSAPPRGSAEPALAVPAQRRERRQPSGRSAP